MLRFEAGSSTCQIKPAQPVVQRPLLTSISDVTHPTQFQLCAVEHSVSTQVFTTHMFGCCVSTQVFGFWLIEWFCFTGWCKGRVFALG